MCSSQSTSLFAAADEDDDQEEDDERDELERWELEQISKGTGGGRGRTQVCSMHWQYEIGEIGLAHKHTKRDWQDTAQDAMSCVLCISFLAWAWGSESLGMSWLRNLPLFSCLSSTIITVQLVFRCSLSCLSLHLSLTFLICCFIL